MPDFAVKLALWRMVKEDLVVLHTHRFGDEEILDIGAITAFFALSNRMAILIELRPDDEFCLMGRLPRQTT